MKTALHFLAVVVFLMAAPSPCFALRSFAIVSKERAKELGIEIRSSKANNTDSVWVELEFKIEGELKEFNPERGSLVELRIADGEKSLLTTALRLKQPSPGRVVASFSADRSQLSLITLSVVVGQGAAVGGAYELRLKDFVEVEKAR